MLRLAACALCAFTLAAQTVTELKLRVEPADRRVRPLEPAVVQVQVQGKMADGRAGRVRRDGFTATTTGGALSKPFRFQGADTNDYLERATSGFGRLLGQGLGQYTIKDSVLFVAPAEPGKYKLEFTLDGVKAETEIEVTAEAATQIKPETRTFEAEARGEDPYRKLAERWAPFIAQETWFQPKSDYLARFDYDGDWRGDNNWDNLDAGSSQAYVYYAAMETATHVFLTYNFFHPRDYSDNCALSSCHENDNEGIILAIQKDGSEFGRLQTLEALAHNNVYSYVNDASLRPGVHDVEGAVAFWKDRPIVFLEAGGHGALGGSDKKSLFDVKTMKFANTGLTYVYKGVAERPSGPMATEVGYELLPIQEHWLSKSTSESWTEPTFDEYYEYQPFGGRPRPKNPRISGAFLGRKEASNKARPFWGWFDTKSRNAKAVATGQWALDPAYSLSRNLTFPREQRYSLDYTFNPYLDIVTESPRASMNAPENFVAATPVPEGGLQIPAAASSAAAAGIPALRGALGDLLGGANRGKVDQILRGAGVGRGGTDALESLVKTPTSKPPSGTTPAATAAATPAPTAAPGPTPAPAPAPAATPAPAAATVIKSCQLSVAATAGADVVVRGRGVEVPAGTEVRGACPLPQASVRLRTQKRSGPGDVRTLELPTAGNGWAVRLRFTQAGTYDVVLSW